MNQEDEVRLKLVHCLELSHYRQICNYQLEDNSTLGEAVEKFVGKQDLSPGSYLSEAGFSDYEVKWFLKAMGVDDPEFLKRFQPVAKPPVVRPKKKVKILLPKSAPLPARPVISLKPEEYAPEIVAASERILAILHKT
ncbi:MAG: hypothetical protein P4L62_03250 [Candidatus Pacebacteria bacterium]|nr:hypothetical protein [Candidatus Paceibacterota bacterium]MDR3583348.1 hypothetical protein [Candidatus Paceibacterota bacterium]